jgi:hypothetical protein
MHAMGMSVQRCVAALASLVSDLCDPRDREWVPVSPPHDSRKDILLCELSFDVSLRNSSSATSAMTEIESNIYLPTIKKVLWILKNPRPVAGASAMEEAREVTRKALDSARVYGLANVSPLIEREYWAGMLGVSD